MSFFENVYETVKKIPKGKVLTYGQIAKIIGEPKKAKFVGYALHKNPDNSSIPCHRVVNRKGELSQSFAFGGIEEQQRMLEEEGIIFENKGIIDLQRYQWK